MIEKKEVKTMQSVVSVKICDRCGKRVMENDFAEWQEFFHWHNKCGYYSVWGDGNVVEVDLCQNCMHELLHGMARVSPKKWALSLTLEYQCVIFRLFQMFFLNIFIDYTNNRMLLKEL
jgi:hypothetical protein